MTWIDGTGYVVSLLESVNEALPRRVWNGIFEAGDWRAYNFAVELRLLVADRVNSGTSVRR